VVKNPHHTDRQGAKLKGKVADPEPTSTEVKHADSATVREIGERAVARWGGLLRRLSE
jgi:hypothetical protein